MCLQLYFAVLFQKKVEYNRRLADIYPDSSLLSPYWIGLYWVCPPVVVYLFGLLLIKETRSAKPIPFIIKNQGWTAALIVVAGLTPLFYGTSRLLSHQPAPKSRTASYWLSQPTIYYMTTLVDEINEMGGLAPISSHTTETASVASTLFPNARYQDFSLTATLLGIAIMVKMEIRKAENPAPSRAEKLRRDAVLVRKITQVLNFRNKTWPPIFKFNPISIYTPMAGLEVALASILTLKLDSVILKYLIPALLKRIEIAENAIKKEPQSFNAELKKELLDLDPSLKGTRDYQIYLSLESSWVRKL